MHDKLAFTAGILLESHQLTEVVQLGLQTIRVALTAGILLESYQLTDATQLGYKPYKDKWLCFHIFKFTSLSTWLLYFWINTIFQLLLQLLIKTIISNEYYIFIQPLLRFLDFSFNDFIDLKNMPVAVGPRDPMLSSKCNSPKRTWV